MAIDGLRTVVRAGAAGVGIVLVVMAALKLAPKTNPLAPSTKPVSSETRTTDHAKAPNHPGPDDKPVPEQAERRPFEPGKLLIGDPVPPLSIRRWFRGEPTSELEPGTVYLIEFWATWCSPCIRAMPHLSELQERHAGDGFRVIAVSIDSASDAEEQIGRVIQNNGDIARFDIAFDSGATSRDWFQAAGQTGIPASFVVDRTGTLAWIGNPLIPDPKTGHPMIDAVVQQVLDGTYDLEAATRRARGEVSGDQHADQHATERQNLTDRMSRLWMDGRKPEALEIIDQLVELDPESSRDLVIRKVEVLLAELNQPEKAVEFAAAMVDGPYHDDPETLIRLSSILAGTIDPGPEGRQVGVLAAERACELVDDEPNTVATLALAQFAAGEAESAAGTMRRAASLCDPDSPAYSTFMSYAKQYESSVSSGND